MVGWHLQFSGHEFEQTVGDSEGQRSLACCSPRGRKESDMTEQLNSNNTPIKIKLKKKIYINKFIGGFLFHANWECCMKYHLILRVLYFHPFVFEHFLIVLYFE